MICGQGNDSNFNKGLQFVEESLANEATYGAAKLLLDFADDLLIFFFKSGAMSSTGENLPTVVIK